MFKKLLIINTFGIGDVLFTTPIIRNVKRVKPNAVIHYLSNSRTAPILEMNPEISRVIVYERDEFVRKAHRSYFAFISKWIKFKEEIQKEGYEAVIDLSLDRGMSFLTLAAGIPRRIGFNYKSRGIFLTESITMTGYEGRHVVEYYCDLLNFLKIPVVDRRLQLTLPESERLWARDWLSRHALAFAQPLVAVVPGGGASWGDQAVKKRWPVEKYVKLVDKIIEKYHANIILFGDLKERELCAEIARSVGRSCYVAAGESTLLQSAALMALCKVALLNDGGPLHVASAVGVKTISIFGPVDDKVYGPYPAENHSVVKKGLACQPCYRSFRMAACHHVSCLMQLEVEDVLRKVEGVL